MKVDHYKHDKMTAIYALGEGDCFISPVTVGE